MIGAQRYHGTDVSDTSKVYGGRGFGYNYDPIGNRTSASETIGGETLVKSYAANELNQYASIANPVANFGVRPEWVCAQLNALLGRRVCFVCSVRDGFLVKCSEKMCFFPAMSGEFVTYCL